MQKVLEKYHRGPVCIPKNLSQALRDGSIMTTDFEQLVLDKNLR